MSTFLSNTNHTVEPSASIFTISEVLKFFAASFSAGAGSSKSSSLRTVQSFCERANLFPSVETVIKYCPDVLRRQVPMYFGKSDGADAAQLPSVMSFPKSEAIISQTSSAPELSGIFGKVSAGITGKRERFLPAFRVPLSSLTSRVIFGALDFRSMSPHTAAFRTAVPDS